MKAFLLQGVLVAIKQPWECRKRGAKVEYLRTP